MAISNREFGEITGCSPAMASRIRTGDRRPSAELAFRIRRAFKLDPVELEKAYLDGTVAFSDYLLDNVFKPSR